MSSPRLECYNFRNRRGAGQWDRSRGHAEEHGRLPESHGRRHERRPDQQEFGRMVRSSTPLTSVSKPSTLVDHCQYRYEVETLGNHHVGAGEIPETATGIFDGYSKCKESARVVTKNIMRIPHSLATILVMQGRVNQADEGLDTGLRRIDHCPCHLA